MLREHYLKTHLLRCICSLSDIFVTEGFIKAKSTLPFCFPFLSSVQEGKKPVPIHSYGGFIAFSLHPFHQILFLLTETWSEPTVLLFPSQRRKLGGTDTSVFLTLKSIENVYKWKCFQLHLIFTSVWSVILLHMLRAKKKNIWFVCVFNRSFKKCFVCICSFLTDVFFFLTERMHNGSVDLALAGHIISVFSSLYCRCNTQTPWWLCWTERTAT